MLKVYKPTTPSRRKMSVLDSKGLSKSRPPKNLRSIKKYKAGRSKGRVTVRHQGGQHKRFYRKIDFKQDKFDIEGKVTSIEYDPNRTSHIVLVVYKDGEKRYIIAPGGLGVDSKILSSQKKIEVRVGNRMPLKYIPLGTPVHNIELMQDQGGKIVRSAGSAAILMGFTKTFAQLKLPSTEVRLVSSQCLASIGRVSNPEQRYIRWGKAGRSRHRGIRPTVRGKAMAPVAHPHGGGEGGSPIGLVHPKTPWGKPALGVKTRAKKKWTNKYIIKRRIKKRKKK
ncbi:50S ribosomal protein L2 [Patescibacteria group bacterium AH-259-L05]|nr:50S ribosomal protein L2 [Patescibacteria group bacterium AH-259-L05]